MSFQCSFDHLIDDESFSLVDNKYDSGRETFAGITRKNFPNWDGWNYIDKGENPPCNLIINFYLNEYWEKLKCDLLFHRVADSIFNFAVNTSKVNAVKLAQKVVGVQQDGIIGKVTIEAINDCHYFMEKYAVEKIKYYVSICEIKPTNKKFFYGWIKNRGLQGL